MIAPDVILDSSNLNNVTGRVIFVQDVSYFVTELLLEKKAALVKQYGKLCICAEMLFYQDGK